MSLNKDFSIVNYSELVLNAFNMLFKIFGKVQYFAKTIVRPNGSHQSWVGLSLYDPTKYDKYWRELSIEMRVWFVSYFYGPREWNSKEWAVEKINRDSESHRQRKKEDIWFSTMTKAPTPTGNSRKQRDSTKNANKVKVQWNAH